MGIIKVTQIIVCGLGLSVLGETAHATLYVYKTPDGAVLYTDRVLHGKDYTLVRASKLNAQSARAPSRQAFNAPRPSIYDRLIRRTADEYEVDFAFVKAIVHAESAFDARARSHKGAMGLMQLMPTTAARYGVRNILDPAQNVDAGVRHLRHLLTRFQNRITLVAAAYNAGEEAVLRYRGIPPYAETQEYVGRVLHYLRQYRRP